MSSATGTQVERRTLLSRSDLDALIQRRRSRAAPCSVFTWTDLNIERGFEVVLKDLLKEIRRSLGSLQIWREKNHGRLH